jgi:outer membrane immunogenic protein
MKRILLAGAAFFAGGTAFAADLPARMPVKAPIIGPAFSWTGCYLGAHIGVGRSTTTFSDPTAPAIAPVIITSTGQTIPIESDPGFIGGGQIGCDYQFASNWVIGLAGDFSWAKIDGEGTDPFFLGKNANPINMRARTDFLATVTGRLGYAFDRFMLYAKGGAAWTHDKYSFAPLSNFNSSFCFINIGCTAVGSETRLGWTAGLGFEWALATHWSALVELDYYGFGTKGVPFTAAGATGPHIFDVKQSFEAMKVGLNYRFGG